MTPAVRRRILWFLAVAAVISLVIWWFWPTFFPSEPRYDRWLNES